MITAELHDNRIYLWSDLPDRERIKLIPGSNWDNDLQMWHLPISWGSCMALRGVFGSEVQIGEKLLQWATFWKQQVVRPALALRPAMEVPELMETEPKLFPYQRVGVRFMETTGQALLADDMGSGKTIQIIRTLARLRQQGLISIDQSILIVCPNSMKYTWRDEIRIWAPDEFPRVTVIDGTAPKRRKQIEDGADVYIINWESLRLHTRIAGYGSIALTDAEKAPKELNQVALAAVVADEGHRAKDPKSKQTRALWAVSEGATFRYAATGTPIESNPAELWSLMHFVSPVNFPRKTKFVDRYCAKSFNPFGGMDITGLLADTQEEFHSIVDPLMLRRPKDVILPQLPEKLEKVRYIPMTGKQEKAYKDLSKSMLAELDSGVLAALNPLQQFIRLSQLASAYAEIDDDGNVTLQNPSNKVDAFLELLEDSGREQIVAFAESKQLINLVAHALHRMGVTYGLITGDTTPDQRAAFVRGFQEGQVQVMLCTSAGAEGITLSAARILVFLQRFWSSIKNQQASDRIHRIGQERGVEIITFATMGTVDEYRELALDEKEEALQEILQDDSIRREMFSLQGKSSLL